MDAATVPVVSRWSAQPGAGALPAGLPGLDHVTGIAGSCREALQAAAKAFPGRDVLVLHADAHLPPQTLTRLLAGWHDASVDVLSPGGSAFADDAEAWRQGEHALWPSANPSPLCSLWRAAAAARWLQSGEAAASLRCFALPCLRVGLEAPSDRPSHGPAPATPALLHVLHSWGGGIERFARDLAAADTRPHLFLLAHNESDRPPFGHHLALYDDLDAPPLQVWPLAAPITSTAIRSSEVQAILVALIDEWAVGGVLVSSLVGHSLDVLRTGLPTACCLHDAYPLWPLLHERRDPRRHPFDDAALAQTLADADAGFPFAERDPAHWRTLRHAWLEAVREHAITLVAPSRFAHERMLALAPALADCRWQQIPHGLADFADTRLPAAAGGARAPGSLRVLVPGRINGAKGERLLAELLPLLPPGVELILLGCGHAGQRFLGHPQVHLLKDYRHQELPRWIAALCPDLALLPSLVPETFGYALSEMLALGLPVLAADIGAYAERIGPDCGWTVAPAPAAFAARLGELLQAREQVTALHPRNDNRSCSAMAAGWREALTLLPSTPRFALASPERIALQAARSRIQTIDHQLAASHGRMRVQQEELDRRAEWAWELESRLQHQEQALSEQRQALRLLDTQATALTSQLQQHELLMAQKQQILEREHERAEKLESRLQEACTALKMEQTERRSEQAAHTAEVASLQSRLEDSHRYYQQDTADLAHQRDIALAQRDDFQQQLRRLQRNPWWRLGAPLRWCVHRQRSLRAMSGYRLRQALQLWRRLRQSLRLRGWQGTWLRIRQLRQARESSSGSLLVPNGHALAEGLRLPETDAPRASVIVPVYGQLDFSLACLRALADCGDATPFEVIVVDDASPDGSGRRLEKIPGLRYLRHARNAGFIASCNTGAAAARGEFLVFLNNDTAVQPGWLDALLGTFTDFPDTGLAGSQLIYPDGRLQEAGGIVFSDGSGWNYGRFGDPQDPRYGFVREADYCSGAAIAIRRGLFAELGGFDPHYAPAYYEDTDLAMRVRAAGKKVRYQPRSRVVHYEGVSSGTDITRGVKAYQVANQQKFLARWRETLRTRHPAPGTDITLACEHRARRRVLVLDACTPTPDRDSGSLRMLAILRLLREEGAAVEFFPENLAHDGPYTEALQQLGVCCWWQPWLGSVPAWLEAHGPRFDVVIASRHYVLSPLLPLLRRFAPRAQIVFDTVDLHHLREQREAELAGDGSRLRAAERTREVELSLIRASDRTWVVSEAERTLLATRVPTAKVEVVSNIHQVRGPGPGFAERSGLLFVGGYRHPPNVDAALWLAEEIWPRIRAAAPEVELHLVGGDAPEQVVRLGEQAGIRFHGYVADLLPLLDRCRVGVAPLRYGAGVKGKVNHALAHGQPMVATSCAVEGMHLRDGEDVLVADDPAAFAAAVLRLHGDEALWQRLVEGGLANTQRHFSADAARPLIRELLAPGGSR